MENDPLEPLPKPEEPLQPKARALAWMIDLLETLVLAALLFVVVNAVSARIRVEGSSMVPTLQDGEYVIVNKLAYRLGRPETGDVVVFYYPLDPSQEYIKRVIGRPGDQVNVLNGRVYVNGQELDEPYIAARPAYRSERKVPGNAIYVLGDNRNNSSDSHSWGPVEMKYVIGKAVFVYWPPQRWGLVAHASAAGQAPEN